MDASTPERQHTLRFEAGGHMYRVADVASALELVAALPVFLQALADSPAYRYDPGWQDALAEVQAFVAERTGL